MPAKRKSAESIDDIQNDLYSLREDVSNLAEQVTQLLSDKSEDVVGDLKERITRMRDTIDGALSGAGDRGRAAVRDARESIDGVTESIEESVRERPLTMLALALGVGLILGKVLRR